MYDFIVTMSLFPAYNTVPESSTGESNCVSKPGELAWLTNQSFIPFGITVTNEQPDEPEEIPSEDNQSDKKDDAETTEKRKEHSSKRKHKKKHKKKHTKRKRSSSSSSNTSSDDRATSSTLAIVPSTASAPISEAEYYTDLSALKIYLTVEKLHRPACPRYRLGTYKALGSRVGAIPATTKERIKRYFRVSKQKQGDKVASSKLTQEEIFSREAELERSIRASETVEKWIDLVRFRADHPIHFDSYQNHKRELSLIERARRQYPSDERLLELYLEAIVRVHPTDVVLDLIRRAIAKDETNVTLWRALISNKQCAMAQCIVPDVLKLYAKSTRALFMARRSDETMLQLFRNCGTFCRQAGLCELLFGMVRHALSMNVDERFGAGELFSSPEHFPPLIEYEELILKSGLPMNEIWLRVELLRAAYHYLPFEGGRLASDPQRMVLTDDVVGFVYPLINKSYAFELTLTVLKLMKYPFLVQFDEEEPYEADYSEQLLTVFLHPFRSRAHDRELYALIKQLSVAPSYIGANLAHESYLEMLRNFLVLAIDHFTGTQSAILLTLFIQLERILVCEQKLTATDGDKRTLDETKTKSVRARVKHLLKHTHGTNQNSLPVYAEYGLLEYEMSGLSGACRKIFSTSVQVYCANEQHDETTSDDDSNELYHLVLTMVELLLSNGHKEEAIRALTNLALKPHELTFEEPDTGSISVPDTVKLSALQRLSDRVNRAVRSESQKESASSTTLPTEQYFTSNAMVNSIRAYILYLALIRTNLSEASKQLETFLYLFNDPSNTRQRFLRQHLYELYLQLFELDRLYRNGSRTENVRLFLDLTDRTLREFPGSLFALRTVVFNENLPWLRLRGIVGKHLTPRAVLLLIVAARARGSGMEREEPIAGTATSPYKQRVLNLLASALKRSDGRESLVLHRNALLWRVYLREQFDQPNAPVAGSSVLEQCRRTLYAALEACPWNKALYLDGASCAPQELSQLLDLMVEKQLRVHAIPEELAILREDV
uniref:Uncharacterized protein n=1 Tax=Anopheles farauti TaxID=69004 RepID=A0A182QB26_9DIPT